jgi:hypothetical protein
VYDHVQIDLMKTEAMSVNRIAAIVASVASDRRGVDAVRAFTTAEAGEARQP